MTGKIIIEHADGSVETRDVDEIMMQIASEVLEINAKLETAKTSSVDYLTGIRSGLIDAYLLLNGLTAITKVDEL